MKKVLLSTIWHTGSEYMRRVLEMQGYNVTFQHCEAHLWKVLSGTEFDEIHTTYRDPYLVAASWCNQYDPKDLFFEISWLTLWSNWRKLIIERKPYVHLVEDFTGKPINSAGDRLGIHKALQDKDWDRYYSHVPVEWIDAAFDEVNQCSQFIRH